MEYKNSAKILIEMLKKPLESSEKQALEEAIGLLLWADLSKAYINKMKNKRESMKK